MVCVWIGDSHRDFTIQMIEKYRGCGLPALASWITCSRCATANEIPDPPVSVSPTFHPCQVRFWYRSRGNLPATISTPSYKSNFLTCPYGPSTAALTSILHSSSTPNPCAFLSLSTLSFIRFVNPSRTLTINVNSPVTPVPCEVGTVAAVNGCASQGKRAIPGITT